MSAPQRKTLAQKLFEPNSVEEQALVPKIATYAVLAFWSLPVALIVIAFLALSPADPVRSAHAAPPRPSARDSAASTNRRCRSFKCGKIEASFCARATGSSIPAV